MNEPNKPAEGITPLENPSHTLPPFWWLNPWRAAIQQAKSSDIYRAWWLSTDNRLCKTAVDLAGEKLKAEATDKAILDTANEAGFTESKYGYAIPGQPHSPFPLKWLGEAVAYWKGEAYAARKQRDEEIIKYCDAMKVIRNADDELSKVRGELSDAFEQANKAGDDIEKLAAKALELEQKVNHLESSWPRDLNNGGKIYGSVYVGPNPEDPDHPSETTKRILELTAERDTLKSCNESLKSDLDWVIAQRDSLLAGKPMPLQRMSRAKRKPAKKGGKR